MIIVLFTFSVIAFVLTTARLLGKLHRITKYDRHVHSAWALRLPRGWAIKFLASRWPWQYVPDMFGTPHAFKYGWMRNDKNPFGRFGAGWDWNVGVRIAKRTILLELLFGMASFSLMRSSELPE